MKREDKENLFLGFVLITVLFIGHLIYKVF